MYDATLKHMDYTVGEIVSAAQDLSDNLILIVVGDHGELFGELGLLGHNLALHEKLIRVPMIVSGIPDVVTNKDTMAQQIDITRTLGEIAGVKVNQFEGKDLRSNKRPYAISQRGQTNLTAYTKHSGSFDTNQFFEAPYTVVTDSDYKLATNDDRTELYCLPDEETDYSESEPDLADQLQSVVEKYNISWTMREQQSGVEFDDSQLKQLRDLGYVS
jgi:uncharacterized sulfatase